MTVLTMRRESAQVGPAPGRLRSSFERGAGEMARAAQWLEWQTETFSDATQAVLNPTQLQGDAWQLFPHRYFPPLHAQVAFTPPSRGTVEPVMSVSLKQ